jgi:hypothetical protein
MTTTVHLEASQVPATLRGSYSGKKFEAQVCTSVTIPATVGLWDGGSRDDYYGVALDTGETFQLPHSNAWPGFGARREVQVTLEPGKAVVRHSIFCGEDMGLTFYVHPDNAAKLLPKGKNAAEAQR